MQIDSVVTVLRKEAIQLRQQAEQVEITANFLNRIHNETVNGKNPGMLRPAPTIRNKMTIAARRKISAAQKARWANQRTAATPKLVKPGKAA